VFCVEDQGVTLGFLEFVDYVFANWLTRESCQELLKLVGKRRKMVVNDPIGDMLIRIKNGYLARKDVVEVPYSRIKHQIAKLLTKEGYLASSKSKIAHLKRRSRPASRTGRENPKFKILELKLKYKNKRPAIEEVKRVSKPGIRIYAKADEIPKVKYGFGITVVSTSKGIMTDKEARKKNLGGEVICQIW